MKIIILWCLMMACAHSIYGQAPKAFKYQAIARDEKGEVIGNKQVSFRFSIHLGSETGKLAYSEVWSDVMTNEYGLITLEIGNGKAENGDLASVQWSEGSHFVAVQMDPDNGRNWQLIGVSQLLSVPYALHAITVETVSTDASLTGKGTANEPLKVAPKGIKAEHLAEGAVTAPKLASMSATTGQVLKWNGSQWGPDTDLTGGSNWTKTLFGLTYTGGNVGIGSTNVSSTLTLHGGLANTELRFFNNSTGALFGDGMSLGISGASPNDAWLMNRENASLRLGANNKAHLTIYGDGTVYIPGVTIINQLSFNYSYSSAVGLSIKGIYQQTFERINETPLRIRFPGIPMHKIVILNVEVGWIASGHGNFVPDRYRSLKDGIWYEIAENAYFNDGFEGLIVHAPDKAEYWFMPVRVTYLILH